MGLKNYFKRDQSNLYGGIIFFGGSNSSYFSGELEYFNVTSPYDQWKIAVDQ